MSANEKTEAEILLKEQLTRLLLEAASDAGPKSIDELAEAIARKLEGKPPKGSGVPGAPVALDDDQLDLLGDTIASKLNLGDENSAMSTGGRARTPSWLKDARVISLVMFTLGLAMLVFGTTLAFSRDNATQKAEDGIPAALGSNAVSTEVASTAANELWLRAAEQLQKERKPNAELHCGAAAVSGACQSLEQAREAWFKVEPEDGDKFRDIVEAVRRVADCPPERVPPIAVGSITTLYTDAIESCLKPAAE